MVKKFTWKKPNWVLTLLTLLFLALFLSLGFWQLDRAQEKELLIERFQQGLAAPPVSLNHLVDDATLIHPTSVTVTGVYDNAHNILLDNKIYQHRVGYEVLTPFYVIPAEFQGNGKARVKSSRGAYMQYVSSEMSAQRSQNLKDDGYVVLINRGWIAAPRERTTLPNIPAIQGTQTIIGITYVPSDKSFTLKHIEEPPNTWPFRVQTLNIPELKKRLNKLNLYPFTIRLNSDAQDGLIREWQPVNMSPYKHIGYAAQWFTFALVLIIIFVALTLRRKKSANET